ncbi:DUF11 domain-containing protein [Streptomyces sp. NPDC020965]|uniref:DUF11 domain-containing protein n=1 Tax=Streptomyces sp. NPDC020965 TaxID=3365105 RepID=UPI0037B9808C
MRTVPAGSTTALRRAGGSIAVCCVLGVGLPLWAPTGAAADGTAGPSAVADRGATGTTAPERFGRTGSPSPGSNGSAPASPRTGADLALATEVGHRGAGRTGSPAHRPVGTAEAAPDGVFDYSITALNHGPSGAVNVVITDELPAALVFVSSPDGCTAQGRTVTCGPLPTLAVGSSHTWRIVVALADDYTGDGSDITNVVAVASQTADPYPANNTAAITGLPVPPGAGKADLSLRKTALLPDGRRTVSPGDTFTYRITVHNNGPAAARHVRVTDPLPDVLRFLSSPDGCLPSGGTVSCPTLDRLSAGGTITYEIVVRVRENALRYGGGDSGGGGGGGGGREIDNIASVTSTTSDPVPGNNSNRSGTTGPDGGPLRLTHPTRPTHPTHPTHPGGPHPTHPTRPHLAHTGDELPGWLPWSAALSLAAGSALVILARRLRG